MNKKYRPSNGTEGEIFMANWCEKCERDHKYQETGLGEDGCIIIAKSMAYNIDDPEYPAEWVVEDGDPKCTAFIPEGEPIPYRCDKTEDMFTNINIEDANR